MEKFNWFLIMATGIIPMIIGMIYYNPKVFGNYWMNAAGITFDPDQKVNMTKNMIISLICGVLIAIALAQMVIHQMGFFSIFGNDGAALKDANSDLSKYVADFMGKYGNNFRTFKHGFLHGGVMSTFFVAPIVATSSLWENRGWRYWLVTWGYWFITLGIMGGIICQFA
jgi:Protein of unknown function (DUF1761)